MSGRDEVIWSKEPPSEPGKYWLKWPCHEDTIGDFTGKHWWLVCGNYSITSEQLIDLGWQFGPRIPSPSELTAAAKRVEEVEGDKRQHFEVVEHFKKMLETQAAACREEIASLTSQLAALKAVAVNNEPLEERLGRLFRQVWIDWAKEQPDIAQRPDWIDHAHSLRYRCGRSPYRTCDYMACLQRGSQEVLPMTTAPDCSTKGLPKKRRPFIDFRSETSPRWYLRIGCIAFIWWPYEPWYSKLEVCFR